MREGYQIIDTREQQQAAIAATLTKIYKFFIQIGYITEAEVSWPEGRVHGVLHRKWAAAGYNDIAIRFIKKIPWMTTNVWMTTNDELIWNSPGINFSFEYDIKESRHPAQAHHAELFSPDDLQTIQCNEVPLTLTTPGEFEGVALVIDAKTALLQWNNTTNGRGQWQDAVAELEKIYNRFTSLEWLPVGGKILHRCVDPFGRTHPESKFDKARAGLFEYGWPDNFRREDWRRDIDANWEKWEREERAEYQQEEAAMTAREGMGKLQIQDEM